MNFNEMNILNEIKMSLEDMGFESPTPVQEEVIPLILQKSDVIAQAPTGTGKTCAFGIPVINNIDPENENVQALVLCPTRELVIQTENELKEVCKYSPAIKIVSIYGGQNIDRQLAGLRKKPQIVIGTTGRIMDHLRRKSLKIAELKVLILDEVDEMLNMGFREDIDVILESAPKERQTVLFSATMPKEIVEISKLYQINPISVKTLHQENDIPNINQYYVTVGEAEKVSALVSIMHEKKYGLSLVFCNTKKRVEELNTHLNSIGLTCDALHGDLRQRERDRTMKKFRGGETQILIATDVAARGIDVDNIEAVFNFDAPHDEEYYVHRIGRTARANKVGDAYTFVSDKQMYVISNCERYTKSTIIKADYSKGFLEKTIDKKLFHKTLKLVKRGDLTSYKEFLEAELEEFKLKYEATEMIDIASALLLQINEMQTSKPIELSEPPKLAMKEKRSRASRKRDGGTRFFMNIGTRDKCTAESITKMICSKTDIKSGDILDVYCLENYSFATVVEGHEDAMDSLNGYKCNKRIMAVEVASQKDGGKDGKDGKVGKDGGRGSKSKSDFVPKPRPKSKRVKDTNGEGDAFGVDEDDAFGVDEGDVESNQAYKQVTPNNKEFLDESSSDESSNEERTATKRTAERAKPKSARVERAGSDRAGSERARSDRAGSDRAGSERVRSSRAGSDRSKRDFGGKKPYERRAKSEYKIESVDKKPTIDPTDKFESIKAVPYEKSKKPRRDFGDRPKRDFGDRPKRDFGDRPKRDFGDRPKRDFADRPKRDFGDKSERPYGARLKRDFSDKPKRDFDDRPERNFGDKPFGAKPKRDFGDRPKRDFSKTPNNRPFNKKSAPARKTFNPSRGKSR